MAMKLTPEQIKSMSGMGVSPEAQSLLMNHYGYDQEGEQEQDPNALQTLSRDSDIPGQQRQDVSPASFMNLFGEAPFQGSPDEKPNAPSGPPIPPIPPQAPVAVYGKYQPNAGAPNYQPNPGAEGKPMPVNDKPQEPSALSKAFSSKDPLVNTGGIKDAARSLGLRAISPLAGGFIDSAITSKEKAPEDKKGPGESDKVVDKENEPTKQDVTNGMNLTAMQAQQTAQANANAAAAKAYNETLNAYKMDTEASFNKTVGGADAKLEGDYDARGNLLDDQAKQFAGANDLGANIMLQTRQRDLDHEQKIRDSHQAQLQWKIDEMDKLNKKLMNTEIDTDHYWSSKNVPQKIIFALGSILQSGAQRRDVVQDAIDQDIKMQINQYDRKKAGLAGKETIYAQMMNLFKDDEQGREKARLATEVMTKNFVSSRLDSLAANHTGQLGKNAAAIEKDKIGEKLAQESFQLHQMLNPPPKAPGMGGAGGSIYAPFDAEKAVSLPNGLTIIAPTAKEAQETRDVLAINDDIQTKVDRMRQILQTHGNAFGLPIDAQTKEYEALRSQLKINVANKSRGLERSDSGMKLVTDAVSLPDAKEVRLRSITGTADVSDGQLKNFATTAHHTAQSTVRAMNGEVIRDGYSPDKNGIPKRVMIPTGQNSSTYKHPGLNQDKKTAASPTNIPGMTKN